MAKLMHEITNNFQTMSYHFEETTTTTTEKKTHSPYIRTIFIYGELQSYFEITTK